MTKLAVGQVWQDRNGEAVEIIESRGNNIFKASNGFYYIDDTEDIKYWHNETNVHSLDLIEFMPQLC